MKKEHKGQVRPIEKVSFATFFFGQGLIYALAGGNYLLYFLTDYALIDPFIVTALLLVAKIWDAVNDVLFGLIVDRVRFKSGNKYKPWLWLATFLVPILTVVMFSVNADMSMGVRIAVFAVGYFLWDTAYTICDAPAFALVTSMTTDVKERINLTTFANIGGLIATGLFTIAFVPFFDKYGYFNTALLIAPIAIAAMLFLCIFSKERVRARADRYRKNVLGAPVVPADSSRADSENLAFGASDRPAIAADEPPASPPIVSVEEEVSALPFALAEPVFDTTGGGFSPDAVDTASDANNGSGADKNAEPDSAKPEKPPTLRETFKYLVNNKFMLLFYLYRIVSGALFIQLTTYIAKHYFGDIVYVTYTMLFAIPMILLVYLFSGKITKRFDKVTIYKFSMIAMTVLSIVLFFAAKNSVWVYMIGMAMIAAVNILPAIFMTAIPGDCAEYGTYKTGVHNEGVTFSLQTFTAKITSAVSLALSSALLGFIGYSGELEIIPQATLEWMWAIGTLMPAAAQIIGLPILFFYKLKDKDAQTMSDYNHGKITREECDRRLSRKY